MWFFTTRAIGYSLMSLVFQRVSRKWFQKFLL